MKESCNINNNYKKKVIFIVSICAILVFSFFIMKKECKDTITRKLYTIINDHKKLAYIRMLNHHKTHSIYVPSIIFS